MEKVEFAYRGIQIMQLWGNSLIMNVEYLYMLG